MGTKTRNTILIGKSRARKRPPPGHDRGAAAPAGQDGVLPWRGPCDNGLAGTSLAGTSLAGTSLAITSLAATSLVGNGHLCVLIVDDDANAADGLSTMVKTWGHQVQVAGDGRTALKMVSAFRADVVLLDIVMPNLDGCEVARQLRRKTSFEDTLLIALLDREARQHRDRAEKAGVDLCLIKPVEPSTLEVLLLLEQDWLAQDTRAPRLSLKK